MDKFKKVLVESPEQLSFSRIKLSNQDKLKGLKPDALIIVGMGGSGQVGDIIKGLKKELGISIPVLVWKNCGLPETNFKNPLYLFISFSGNTDETLSGFKSAKNKIVVCSGGELMKLANKAEIPAASFDMPDAQPRQSGGIMFFAALGLLKTIFPKMKAGNIKLGTDTESRAKTLAGKLKDKIITIYSSQKNKYLAYNLKTRLNETAKMPAFSAVVPEACHNEIEIYENREFVKNSVAVFLQDKDDAGCLKSKMEKFITAIESAGAEIEYIELSGKNGLEKTWNCLHFSDWLSYHLAEISDADPAAINLIKKFKSLK